MRPLVIGIGNRWRRDDGVGPRAVDALAPTLPCEVDTLVLDGEPARLVTAWKDRTWVVLIDAVRTGREPGTIHHLDGHAITAPIDHSPSTHGAGLITAIELARALGRLPERLTIVGIEPSQIDDGDEFSDPVAAAFEPLVEHVRHELLAVAR